MLFNSFLFNCRCVVCGSLSVCLRGAFTRKLPVPLLPAIHNLHFLAELLFQAFKKLLIEAHRRGGHGEDRAGQPNTKVASHPATQLFSRFEAATFAYHNPELFAVRF